MNNYTERTWTMVTHQGSHQEGDEDLRPVPAAQAPEHGLLRARSPSPTTRSSSGCARCSARRASASRCPRGTDAAEPPCGGPAGSWPCLSCSPRFRPAGAAAAQGDFFGPAKDLELQPELTLHPPVPGHPTTPPRAGKLDTRRGLLRGCPGRVRGLVHAALLPAPPLAGRGEDPRARSPPRPPVLRDARRWNGNRLAGPRGPVRLHATILPAVGDPRVEPERAQVRWTFGSGEHVSFLYRGRLQLEREFEAGQVGLTPFANGELFWQAPPSMWQQFRMQAGLQCSFGGIGRGQVIEVNYSTATYLQPTRSWKPVIGVIWYLYI